MDGLTSRHAAEVKSSRRSAKNPGHNMTKVDLLKLHSETKKLSEEFGVELRAAYAIDIVGAGGVMWAIPEKWFFRYLVAFEMMEERWDQIHEPEQTIREVIDAEVEKRINEKCAARYR